MASRTSNRPLSRICQARVKEGTDSLAASSAARPWYLVADERSFYLAVSPQGTADRFTLLHAGDIASLKHYLPRILELAKNTGPYGETDFPELGDVLPKLARLGDPEFPPWWEWPDPERIALRNFMREEWQLACQATDAHDTAGVLGAVLNTDPEIDPYLETWAAAPVDRLRRVEAASWIERPSAEFAPGFARANWQKVRDWVYAQT